MFLNKKKNDLTKKKKSNFRKEGLILVHSSRAATHHSREVLNQRKFNVHSQEVETQSGSGSTVRKERQSGSRDEYRDIETKDEC